MPGRDGTGPRASMGRRINNCRRDNGFRGQNPYCRRGYFESEAVTLKNQAQYYEEELKRINHRLEDLNSQVVSSESSDS